MLMKKKIYLVVLLLTLSLFVFAGCSDKADNQQEEVNKIEQTVENADQQENNDINEEFNDEEKNSEENTESVLEELTEEVTLNEEKTEENITEEDNEKEEIITEEIAEENATSNEEKIEENITEEELNEKDSNSTKGDIEVEEPEKNSEDEEEYIKLDSSKIDSSGETVTYVDVFGKKQVINKCPQRVVCLYNSFADVWHSVGGDIIGRIDSESSLPKSFLAAEIVGSMGGINLEKLLSLQPDLVIMASNIDAQVQIRPILTQNNIPYLCLQYESVEEYLETVKLFSEIIGNDDKYTEIGEMVRKEVNSVINKVPQDKNPSVLILFGSASSVKVMTQYSTLGSMLEDLGTENIAYDSRLTDEQMETFSMEKVVEKDPDFIFVQTMGDDLDAIYDRLKQEVESSPAWSSLTAVKEGRYIVLPKDLYLYKANKRYGQAYDGLARILYPEDYK